jgi:transcriptional regulator with XRE-family HTH domain
VDTSGRVTNPAIRTGHEARTLREGMRLSRRALAQELGINESSINRWERRGDRDVPRTYMRALRDVLRERSARSSDLPARPADARVAQGSVAPYTVSTEKRPRAGR